MSKVKIYPGRAVSGIALMAAAWRYTVKDHNILGFLCMTFGSAFLGKSVIVDG
jgi:hypothetical protein